MNFFDFKVYGPGMNQGEPTVHRHPRQSRAPKGGPVTRLLLSLLITVIFGGIYFYVKLPVLNIHSEEFYGFVILLCIVFSVIMILMQGFRADSVMEYVRYTRKRLTIPFIIVVLAVLTILLGSLTGWVVFRAKAYSRLMPISTGDFASEVSEIGWSQIPLLDEDSANNLANRKLGELSDLVSQFEVDGSSAQINYKGNPVRVNYLNYSDFFKWWNNRGDGIPAYIRIDMRSQEVTVVRLEEGIKYSPSEYFNRNLMRHLRFKYPTLMFDDVNFEIDDEGTPYWIASVLAKRIGLFDGADISGAVLVNAITGETTYYDIEDVPSWVDRAYSANLIVEQYDYYGRYHNGFWNSMFGQKDCTETTDGFNFIAQDDDVWLYTGITSVTGDRGNIGFILVNQRTKEARYYSCAGAEEYSAASSAEGAVQQFSYRATFPLLLNISDQPTYFMALKDAAGLVKMYAMVNVQQYQIVATGNTVSDCQQKYHQLLVENQILTDEDAKKTDPDVELLHTSGKIDEIRSAAIDGNTIYYLRLENSKVYYTVSAKDYPMAVILNEGDNVDISYYPSDETLIEAASLEIK